MKRLMIVTIIMLVLPSWCFGYGFAMSDDQIKAEIIKESINAFYKLKVGGGTPCPCPYSTGTDGQTCGGESAYFKQNQQNLGTDFVLKCFPRDVSKEDIVQFRIEHAIPIRPLNPP